jgi:hypothetical protein
MKKNTWMIVAMSAILVAGPFLLAASSRSNAWDGRQEFKVLRTFSAKDGVYVHRSYLIDWNGQEVVVEDPTALSNYRSDDTITVGIPRRFSGPRGLLSFILVAPKKAISLASGAISASPQSRQPTGGYVELKVLTVYSAQDGEYYFRAYIAEWNGQDVVVVDPRGETKYVAGDPLPTVYARILLSESEMHGVLRFETTHIRFHKKKNA